jgi:hypothetical protein
MSTDAHLDFRLDCNPPYTMGIVDFPPILMLYKVKRSTTLWVIRAI